jgi:hypothetical protein
MDGYRQLPVGVRFLAVLCLLIPLAGIGYVAYLGIHGGVFAGFNGRTVMRLAGVIVVVLVLLAVVVGSAIARLRSRG